MFDPFDPGQAHDAWSLLARLREEGAVVEIAQGMRYVTRHAECRDVLRDTETFSNASGMKAPGVEIPVEDRLLGELDPPRHTRVRRVMVTALAPKVVHAAEPFMRDAAETLLSEITGPTADLVPAFTVQLPNRVTLHLLGLDPADAPQLAAWAKGLMESTFPATNRTERGEGFAGAFPEFAGYIDAHIAERQAQLADGTAPDDVLARLLQLDDDGEQLPLRQVRALVRNLITGGLTTTSQLLGNLLHELLTDESVERALRDRDEALGRAIEESLRLAPPVLFMARGCVRDAEIGGCPIPAGTRVLTGFASANRDERVFAEPDEFRVDRPNSEHHLTFGYGAHVCPGAALARTVARIGIRTFLDRFPRGAIRLAPGFEFENVPTYFERGPKRLPVEITG
ncbi:MAG TPA: cytochrome P450 [Acidimicrobiia bacterium]|nr:cytochrome P450 [Acidimicrobiia bacterium]